MFHLAQDKYLKLVIIRFQYFWKNWGSFCKWEDFFVEMYPKYLFQTEIYRWCRGRLVTRSVLQTQKHPDFLNKSKKLFCLAGLIRVS